MSIIHVLGLGAGSLDQLPLGVYKQLKQAKAIYLRTKEHPVAQELFQMGITFQSFDHIYRQQETFEAVYEQIVDDLFQLAEEKEEICYAVPGHPLVAEKTVQLLLEHAERKRCVVKIGGGQSFIDVLLSRLQIDPVEGLQIVDALSFEAKDLQPQRHTIITQVYDAFVASEVKLTLMDVFPDDYEVVRIRAAGTVDEQVKRIPLYELDRQMKEDNRTSIYVPKTEQDSILNRQFFRSREIFRRLRGPDGCPWDREQTHRSLMPYLLEEANELIEAIKANDIEHMIEELGDVLLQVFLHAQIGEDDGYFTMEDVLQALNEKMIRRHPHVFGDLKLENPNEVLAQWQSIKEEERRKKST